MSVITQPVDLRELAREWIASTLTTHLHPNLRDVERIKQLSASLESEAHDRGLPVELAVGLAVDFAHEENERADLSHASQ